MTSMLFTESQEAAAVSGGGEMTLAVFTDCAATMRVSFPWRNRAA